MEVALAISKGTLQKYINELVSNGMSWLPIKAQLQEQFWNVDVQPWLSIS